MKRGGGGGGGDDLTPKQISDIIARDNKKARTINRQFDELSAKRQRVEALLDKETEAMWAKDIPTGIWRYQPLRQVNDLEYERIRRPQLMYPPKGPGPGSFEQIPPN